MMTRSEPYFLQSCLVTTLTPSYPDWEVKGKPICPCPVAAIERLSLFVLALILGAK